MSVALLYADGRSHKEIARATGLAPATVRTYLRGAYLTLGVSDKVALGRALAGHGSPPAHGLSPSAFAEGRVAARPLSSATPMSGAVVETMRVKQDSAALLSAAIALAVVVVGCGDGEGVEPADVVLRGGKVVTMDGQRRIAQAVAVRDGRIAFVGSDADAAKRIGADTKVIELGGRMLMPGFVDAHLHALAGGRALLLCDLAYAPLTRAQLRAPAGLPGRHARDQGPTPGSKRSTGTASPPPRSTPTRRGRCSTA